MSNPEHVGAVLARVLGRLERTQRALANATTGTKSTNVTLPRAIIEHHASELASVCCDLRTADGETVARAVPARVRSEVLLRAWSDAADEGRGGYVCAKCKAATRDTSAMHVDHIIPLARGGSNDRSNLRALCATCNLSKGAAA